jgi:DNA polymerase III sliding clamp (beta) subunit (PCNA family)
MPAVTIEASSLKRAMAAVKAVVPAKASIPILSCVKIVVRNGVMAADATNLVTSVRCEVPANGDGAWCLDYAKVQSMLSVVPDGAVVGIDGTNIATLRAGRMSARVSSFSQDDFPDMITTDHEPDMSFLVNASLFKDAISRIQAGRQRDSIATPLAGIHVVMMDGRLRIEATTGHVFLRTHIPVSARGEFDIILPGDAVVPIAALPDAGEIEIRKTGGAVSFWSAEVGLATKLLDGIFPDIDRSLAGQVPLGESTSFDVASLTSAIKAVGSGMTWGGEEVDISVSGNEAFVIGGGGAGEEITIPVECEAGAPFRVCISPALVLALLAGSKRETIKLSVTKTALTCLDEPDAFSGLVMSRLSRRAAVPAA